MKNKVIGYLLLMLVLIIASCKKSDFERSVPSTEKECLRKIKQAKKDIKDGKLVYCYHIGHFSGWGYRSEKEMTDILKNMAFHTKMIIFSCV